MQLEQILSDTITTAVDHGFQVGDMVKLTHVHGETDTCWN